MMVNFEDVPLKQLGKWKRKKTKYEAVEDGDEDETSSNEEEDTLYSSDGYLSVETDADEEELKRRDYKYRRARWFVCYGWRWWCQRFVSNLYELSSQISNNLCN